MSEGSSGSYTFYPHFQEFVTLYRGVIRVWIGDGISTGTAGYLYAEYMDGSMQQLGFVSDYEEAKKYFSDLGINLTYAEWVAILARTPENAKRSEAWAVGTQADVPVSQEDQTYQNNSKYYADQSKIWANGNNLNGDSIQPTNNATYWSDTAHGWTNNKSGDSDSYSATNNAKYWAEQSKEYTNGNDLSDNPVQDRATDNAMYYNTQAKLWANNGTDGSSPTAQNNAKYWAEQSKIFSKGTDLSDQSISPTDNAEYYKTQSKLWANNGSEGDSPSATNNAKYYSLNSEENNLQAESWNKGTRDGEPDLIRPNAATDNSAYHCEQSKLWANYGTDGDSPSENNNAKSYSEQSLENNLQAESWATGNRNGEPDVVREDASTNNAMYYSDNAEIAMSNAEEFSLQSESWAAGTRNDMPDTSRQNASTNNAMYYCNQARLWANYGDDEEPSGDANAKEYARLAGVSAETAETAMNNAATYSGQAAASAEDADASAQAAAISESNASTSEANAAESENNAASFAYNAESSATSALDSRQRSESASAQATTKADAAENSANAASISENNAASSASSAATSASLAESSRTAAESAQQKAERAMTKYPRIGTNKNWETWNVNDESWNDTGYKSMAEATITYAYQNSDTGTVPPSGAWGSTPVPTAGKYMWSRMTYTWTNGSVDNFYNVSYMGVNGTGSVNSVNSKGGDVVLRATDITMSENDDTTIAGAMSEIGTSITQNDIDNLFNVG